MAIGAGGGAVAGVTVVNESIDARRFPVESLCWLREQRANARLVTTWTWSGYVPYAWSGRQSFFDGLVFTSATLQALGNLVLARGDWRRIIDTLAITQVMVPENVPMADPLRMQPTSALLDDDATALVWRRSVGMGAPGP